jgi:hypothetical protein
MSWGEIAIIVLLVAWVTVLYCLCRAAGLADGAAEQLASAEDDGRRAA